MGEVGQAAPFVLVHGAGGWCWDPIVPLLEERGHPVYAPSLSGLDDPLDMRPELAEAFRRWAKGGLLPAIPPEFAAWRRTSRHSCCASGS